MACRRGDRAKFIGCHVGPSAIRGCSKDCCPYPDTPQALITNERYDYLDSSQFKWDDPVFAPNRDPTQPSYIFRPCRNPYRPKYVCLDCRKSFKLTWVGGKEYRRMAGFAQPWECRPARDSKEMIEVGRNRQRLSWNAFASIQAEYNAKKADGTLTEEDKREAKRCDADLWWIPLDRLRCPGCGKDGIPVGPTFKAPKMDDDKGWVQVRKMLDEGEEFSYCVTVEEENEAKLEAGRFLARQKNADRWEVEKRRRAEALKMG
ncbi:hypothetical protein JAAARDRAFT_77439 [Jaapia argillacea MUCL 33604]|uniref:Uncharacterized protein n=1 Tax=Jaapia argillacea MUCL 33604 TaxID=933084 RepID=A0A067Q021_9AGAM|nr:hypothetical protein JAAARDRAFT_77439 [Jaapia argillacea MUCL 33604]